MGGMTVPHIFGTITGSAPITVPASYLDSDYQWIINPTGNTAVSHTWFGEAGLDGMYLNWTAAQGNQAERGLFVGMTSSVGSANPTVFYKMGIASAVELNPGSASGWGENILIQANAGAGNIGAIGLEIDGNFFNQHYPLINGPIYGANILLTGQSTPDTRGQAGLMLAYNGHGAQSLWDYGIVGLDYDPISAFQIAFLSDQTTAPITLQVRNGHVSLIDATAAAFSGTAIDFTGAPLSGNLIASSNFSVSSSGIVIGTQLTASGAGDNFIEVKTTLGVGADWYMQVIHTDGSVRIYDNANNVVAASFAKSTGATTLQNLSAQDIYAGAGAALGFTARSKFRSGSDGALVALNSAENDFSTIKGKIQVSPNAVTGLSAGALAATTNASIVILDGSGQAYRIPCII